MFSPFLLLRFLIKIIPIEEINGILFLNHFYVAKRP